MCNTYRQFGWHYLPCPWDIEISRSDCCRRYPQQHQITESFWYSCTDDKLSWVNKIDKAKYLVNRMLEGVNIALITDAGTPGISDPGEELVRFCYEAGIEVTSSGTGCVHYSADAVRLSTRRFVLKGFCRQIKRKGRLFLNVWRKRQGRQFLWSTAQALKDPSSAHKRRQERRGRFLYAVRSQNAMKRCSERLWGSICLLSG